MPSCKIQDKIQILLTELCLDICLAFMCTSAPPNRLQAAVTEIWNSYARHRRLGAGTAGGRILLSFSLKRVLSAIRAIRQAAWIWFSKLRWGRIGGGNGGGGREEGRKGELAFKECRLKECYLKRKRRRRRVVLASIESDFEYDGNRLAGKDSRWFMY